MPATTTPTFTKGAPREQTPARSQEVRDNFAALAANFATNDPAIPANPEEGWTRIIDELNNPALAGNIRLQLFTGGAWRDVLQNLQGGIAAPAKQVVLFSTPATTWVVNHNLGSKPVAQVLDAAGNLLEPVSNVFQREHIFLGRIDTALLGAGPIAISPARFEGRILETYAQAPTGIPGVTFTDTLVFAIDSTPSGGGVVPVTGGGIAIPAGGHAQGAFFAGAAVTAANIFSQQLAVGVGVEDDIVVSATGPTPDTGALDIFIVVERSLQPGQYRLVHVNDNRFNVEHPGLTAGSVIAVG